MNGQWNWKTEMTEHQTVEYKHIWKDAYLKWICGFSNADGGVLVIVRNEAVEVVICL